MLGKDSQVQDAQSEGQVWPDHPLSPHRALTPPGPCLMWALGVQGTHPQVWP